MARIERRLGSALAEALSKELDPDPVMTPEEDLRAQLTTADELVRQALRSGSLDEIESIELEGFSAGNTAMLVARLQTRLSFVVKVDRSPAVVNEAHLLKRAATDPALPSSIRAAFPEVYAIDDEGPIYGYLMENLEDYATLRTALVSESEEVVEQLLSGFWADVLAPAYLATRSTRVVPNVHEDYLERAEQRLLTASGRELLPRPDEPLRIETDQGTLDVPSGWGPALERATEQLTRSAPTFSTFVHGDPNPENVLWRREADGGFAFKLIDPKYWWTGDYMFDVAKIGHYLRVTAPTEHLGLQADISASPSGRCIGYDTTSLDMHPVAEASLLTAVREFAERPEVGDARGWEHRYRLAVAANLLGIVGPRLVKAADTGSDPDRSLALIALGEGLRLLFED